MQLDDPYRSPVLALPTVPNHDGTARSPDRVWFEPPPPSLGRLVSATSTLAEDDHEMSVGWRLVITATALAFVGLIVAAEGPQTFASGRGLGVLALLFVGVVVVWVLTGFNHTCSYVGDAGALTATLAGKRTAQPKASAFRFRDAWALFNSETSHYTNGIYQGTTYDFSWFSPSGAQVFSINGKYFRESNKTTDEIHFARAAEAAWTQHWLETAVQQLEREGSISFAVGSGRVVRIGDGFLELRGFGDEPVRVTRAAIAKISLERGQLVLEHGTDRLVLPYGSIANARAFLFALDKLMGYRL
jgi:hypothetical protein